MDDPGLHQRAQTDGRAAVVGEGQEGARRTDAFDDAALVRRRFPGDFPAHRPSGIEGALVDAVHRLLAVGEHLLQHRHRSQAETDFFHEPEEDGDGHRQHGRDEEGQ